MGLGEPREVGSLGVAMEHLALGGKVQNASWILLPEDLPSPPPTAMSSGETWASGQSPGNGGFLSLF